MSRKDSGSRSSNKRAVIDISDDESNRPPFKKEAEPVPSQEVLELQQKLAKTEKENQKKIDDLTRKLNEFEGRQQQQPARNIFEVHYTKGADSMYYPLAFESLRVSMVKARDSFGCLEPVDGLNRVYEFFKGESLHCALCNTTCEDSSIMGHWFRFHSIEVERNAQHRPVYVSRKALKYWMRKLESITKEATEAQVVSQEMMQLQQALSKTSKDKQSLIRIAGEKQARVEFLENLIDKKPALDDSDKKLAEELQKRIAKLTNDRSELVSMLSKFDGTKREMQMRIDEMTAKLAGSEQLLREKQEKIDEMTTKLAAAGDREKKLMEKHQERIEELTNQRDELARKLTEVEEREKKRAELKEARRKMQTAVAHYEHLDEEYRRNKTTGSVPSRGSALANTGGIDHSKNIFKLLPAGARTSVPYQTARNRISCGNYYKMQQLCKRIAITEKLRCAVCNETFENEKILEHFFTPRHREQAEQSNVSEAAVDYWVQQLWSVTLPTAGAGTVAPTAPRASANEQRDPLVIEID